MFKWFIERLQNIKKYGLKHSLERFWLFHVDKAVVAFFLTLTKNKPLKNAIIIESHNDFDCNGGAFYEYLISKEMNRDYKIIWLLHHPEEKPRSLPKNVRVFGYSQGSILKDYYLCTSKFFLSDNHITNKIRSDQISIYCTHASISPKKLGRFFSGIPQKADYILYPSENYSYICDKQYGGRVRTEQKLFIGFPIHDVLLKKDKTEIGKLVERTYKKTFIWMPTFRKGGGIGRNDSLKEEALGIPLLQDIMEYEKLNEYLRMSDCLLIIKIHPHQDLHDLRISNLTNILVVTWKDMKEKQLDNYRLIRCADALISDFSSIAYDFLQLDRPVAYTMDDVDDYTLGFDVDDIHSMLGGPEIFSLNDLICFFNEVLAGNDYYADKRHMLRSYCYKFHDRNNCQRLAEFMHLETR